MVGAILREHPLDAIAAAVAAGDWLPLIPLALAATVGVLFLVVAWDTMVLRGQFGRPRYRDVLRGKAGTSMLLSLGYGFGHGGYGVWIARAVGASVSETVGVALYISAADLTALSLVGSATIWLGGADVPRALAIAAPAIPAVLIALLLLAPYQLLGETPRVFRPWSTIPRRVGLVSIAGRCVNICLYIAITWGATRAFGLDIPFAVAATYLPVVMLVGSLPINIAGLGPVQGVWLLFFGAHAAGPAILAFQFVWHLMVTAGLVLRGLPFLRGVIAEIERGNGRAHSGDGKS